MTAMQISTASACAAVLETGHDRGELNPIYRALEDPAAALPAPAVSDADLELLTAHLTAPSVLVLAVQTSTGTRRVRVGLHGERATVEEDNEKPGTEEPSQWRWVPVTDVPQVIAQLLPAGPLAAPPLLTQESPGAALRLQPEHFDQLRALLEKGVAPAEAFAQLEGLDERLRDALTAQGDRASLSLTVHRRTNVAGDDDTDAQAGRTAAESANFTRLWTVGELGMYRTDAPEASHVVQVLPVAPGDVLGTVLPLLEEGLSFALGVPAPPPASAESHDDTSGSAAQDKNENEVGDR